MPCCSRPPARWWHIFFSPGPSECWCRACRRELAPGPYGGSDPDQAEPWVRGCCQDGWLAKGWCCRWCGRDEDSGRQGAARGIYGGRANYRESGLESLYCACGLKVPYTKWNYASCRSCYWVLTRQLVRRFLKVFGPWSQIHDGIFLFLIETRFNHEDPSTDALYRADGLAEVRQHGLRLGSASSLPGVLRRRVVGMEGQRCFAMRYRMGDVDWIPYTEALGPDPRSEHILVWHPPMEAPPRGALGACGRRARPRSQASVGPRDLEPAREGPVGAGAEGHSLQAGTPAVVPRSLRVVRAFHGVVLRRNPGHEHLSGMVVRVSSLLLVPTSVRAVQVLLPLDRAAGACGCGRDRALPGVGGGARADRQRVRAHGAFPAQLDAIVGATTAGPEPEAAIGRTLAKRGIASRLV